MTTGEAIVWEEEDSSVDEQLTALHVEPAAEDHAPLRALLEDRFGDALRVLHVPSIEAALDILSGQTVHVVFSESRFARQESVEATISALQSSRFGGELPIVILTGDSGKTTPVRAFQAGAIEFVRKDELDTQAALFRVENLMAQTYRSLIVERGLRTAMDHFEEEQGLSQQQIAELDKIVTKMRADLEAEFRAKEAALEERRKLQSTFGMFVDPRVVEAMARGDVSPEQKGQEMELSVLFTDIRGYTALSEQMTSRDIVAFLNQYFTALTEVILGFEGSVDKYIGDSIMALFGAPLPIAEHRDRAVEAALEMQSVFRMWQPTWEEQFGVRPQMGIGIASGPVTVGNLGSFQKLSYTAIGDAVNTAARLESLATAGQVLLSEDTSGQLTAATRARFVFKELEPVAIKGKTGLHRITLVEAPQ